jgi:hypothetical protein
VLDERDDHALTFFREMLRELVQGQSGLLFDQVKLRQQFVSFHSRVRFLLAARGA